MIKINYYLSTFVLLGRQACTKVYMWFTNATNVKDVASLKGQDFTPASKKLILNMDDLGIFIDNIEGVTLVQNWLMANNLCFLFLIIISLIKNAKYCFWSGLKQCFKLLKSVTAVLRIFRSYFKETEFKLNDSSYLRIYNSSPTAFKTIGFALIQLIRLTQSKISELSYWGTLCALCNRFG
jgi:hypothetical protein